MIISFDLDDTIIPSAKRFETEAQHLLQRVLKLEKIRVGTIQVMKHLKTKGHKIYIYTTSLRSTAKIWWTFYLHGIKLDKVINHTLHETVVTSKFGVFSKFPPAFNIDFHIDDSHGVQMEGDRGNFKTIIVDAADPGWVQKILNEIDVSEHAAA